MTENNYREAVLSALDEIIPADGAKERMLANIKRKSIAANQKPAINFAKWTAPLAACLAAAVITAVGVKTITALNETPAVSEPLKPDSPVRLVGSAAAFTEELKITVDAPEGAKNVQYRIVDDDIADITFVYNDIDYTLRASKQNGDFSGINGTAVLSELIRENNNAVLTAVTDISNETYLKLEWNNGKTRYILSCKDREADSNSADIKTSDHGTYSHTEAANNIIDLYSLIK
ncbi:MAG: hypothetical protein K2N56_06235 [Oscillospiraceae bacterium]|nr:hypothetical protein [Oscillospiraceae bacterium]